MKVTLNTFTQENLNYSWLGESTLFCSRHWDGEDYLVRFYTFLAVLYVVISLRATLENLVILVALQKDASLRPTSKILLRNLTITDLCAGLISQPLAMTIFLSLITENWTLCRKAKNSAYIVTTVFFGVSLATLTSIAVERLLALFLGIRYGQVEIVRRTLTVVLFI